MNRHAVIFWLTLALGSYGIVDMVWRGSWGFLMSLLIPVLVFAVIFLLYKYLPGRRTRTPKIKPSARTILKQPIHASSRLQASAKRILFMLLKALRAKTKKNNLSIISRSHSNMIHKGAITRVMKNDREMAPFLTS